MVSPTQTGAGGRRDPVSAAGNAVQKKTIAEWSTSGFAARCSGPSSSPAARAIIAGAGAFNVDLSLQARTARANLLVSAAAGYKPFFNDPSADTFHPGPDLGAAGLVVTLSTTPSIPGT